MLSTALFLFWQTAMVLAAARFAGRSKRPAGDFFVVLLSAAMLVEGISGSAISFIRANSIAAYVLVGAACFAFGARRRVVTELWTRLRGLSVWRFRITAAVLVATAIPLFFLTLKPIDEPDSVNYLHYLLEWRAGRLTPYTFSTNYVAFGPSRFLPALVLTRTDWFFGFVAVEPVLLLAVGLWLIGSELEIPPRLRLWSVAAAVALQHFWGCHSGVGTIKTDALHAAGVVLLALVLMRTARAPDRFSPLLFACAAAFTTEKYTGVFLSIIAIGALLWMRIPIRRMLPAALVVLCTTGHYYLRSLFQHGNPFYPFTVRLGPIALPGTGDLSDTSILANWRDPRLWKLFFEPAHGISPAGLLFPVILALLLAAAMWTVITGLRRRPPVFGLAALLLAGWLLFARTFWGAGPQPHSLGFLETDLSTLRYVEGFLALGEIFLAWFLWKRGVPEWALLAVIGMHGASRLWLLYRQPNLRLFAPALWIGAALLAGLVVLRFAGPMVAFVGFALVIAAPAITERNREMWFPEWRSIWQPFRELAPTSIFLFDDPATGFSALHFALCGPYLKHDVRTSPDMRDAGGARYAIRLRAAPQPDPEVPGYHPVLQTRSGTVLERLSTGSWNANDREAWYLTPGNMAAPDLPVDAGTAADSRHRMKPGELVLEPPLTTLRLTASGTQVLDPPEGAALRLMNCGPLENGQPRGLTCRYHDGRWQMGHTPLPLPASPIVSIERGSFQVERLSDDQGPYLRIRAQNDAQWCVMVTALPGLKQPEPFTAFANARCPKDKSCTFWLWTRNEVSDYQSPPAGEWHNFHLWRRANNPAPDDHLAIGRKDVRAGDFFDVRELGAIAGIEP
jgi:hypothetical protein